MKSNATYNAIAALDLEPIKTKLMHVASGEGWSRARADAMDTEYRRFLYLMHAFPDEQTAPTVDVDTFWHYHILDTMKYAADCERVFGQFMHHYPYLGMEGNGDEGAEQRGAERMRELYEATFGEDYIRAEAYGEAAASAYCMLRPGDKQAAKRPSHVLHATTGKHQGAGRASGLLHVATGRQTGRRCASELLHAATGRQAG
ncbi:glycine-rich domain-containing protein-like [Massilia sp. H-1]|nr:glycine-rich domain-containing protein-like [Massilia sp. H-1]